MPHKIPKIVKITRCLSGPDIDLHCTQYAPCRTKPCVLSHTSHIGPVRPVLHAAFNICEVLAWIDSINFDLD